MSNEISGNLEKLEIVEACKRLIVEVSVGMWAVTAGELAVEESKLGQLMCLFKPNAPSADRWPDLVYNQSIH